MKKLLLIALGCGLTFGLMGCSDDNLEDLAQKACEHQVECGLLDAEDCESDADADEDVPKDICKGEQKSLAKCISKADCSALEDGTACESENAKLATCMVKEMMGGLGGLF